MFPAFSSIPVLVMFFSTSIFSIHRRPMFKLILNCIKLPKYFYTYRNTDICFMNLIWIKVRNTKKN